MMKTLVSLVDLFFADMHRRNGRIAKARRSLDKVIHRSEKEFEFLAAYDATLMVREDRLSEARTKFEQCLSETPQKPNSDERYIELYCRFFLSVYEASGEAQYYRAEALKLEPDSLIKTFLRFPTEEKLRQIVSS